MKKIVLILMALSLFIPITAKANTQITLEDEVEFYSQFNSYQKTVQESLVEQETYRVAKYTNNMDKINTLLTDVKGFLGRVETDLIQGCDTGFLDCVGTYAKVGTGVLMTSMDWWKDLFNGFKEEQEQQIPDGFLIRQGQGVFELVDSNLRFQTNFGDGQIDVSRSARFTMSVTTQTTYKNFSVYTASGGGYRSPNDDSLFTQKREQIETVLSGTTLSFDSYIQAYKIIFPNFTYQFVNATTNEVVSPNLDSTNTTINNYIQNNSTGAVYPKLQPKLVCPSGEIINLSTDGTSFIDSNGNVVTVAANGSSIINGVECLLDWNKPKIEVSGNGEEINVIQPDGTITEIISGEDKSPIQMPECDGVLCWLTNIFKNIASIPMAIVSGLLDGLIGLFKTLFVPSADSFKNFISSLNTTISEKMNAPTLANIFTEISPQETATAFDGIKVSGLMGSGEVTIIDSSSINSVLPTVHSWIKGFFYVLLALFNINHLYRLIRGTTIFESMRGKTE